jgi:hypothetical protein
MSGSNSQRLAGVIAVTVDGTSYDVVGDWAYSVTTVKRETLSGQTRVEGYSEMPVSGFQSGKLRDNGAFSVAAFNALTNSTVIAQAANGKTIYGAGMWTTEVSEVNTAEGSFSVKFEGGSITEDLT